MELSSGIFTDVLGPLAAFKSLGLRPAPAADVFWSGSGSDATHTTTVSSQHRLLEPHENNTTDTNNDITSETLTLLDKETETTGGGTTIKWTIHGADPDGRRFFGTPDFAFGGPPLRIDVYVPPVEKFPAGLRQRLKPESIVYTARREVPQLAISRYLATQLSKWATETEGFEGQYKSLPFGSRILVAFEEGGDEVEVYLCPDYDVEQGMVGVDVLKGVWSNNRGGIADGDWPEIIDLDELEFQRQLHEAISVVTIRNHTSSMKKRREQKKEWVFKSLVRDQRYLYNELKMFLTLEPHDNVIGRPRYIVTKKGRFGGRRGVCGFVIELFESGSLKQFLLDTRSRCGGGSMISMEQKLRWARQITQALMHINAHAEVGFYPDMKPDNIVLREGKGTMDGVMDMVLLDLEQRGGWFSWSPPEVAYLEYLEVLAAADMNDEDYDDEFWVVREEITAQLEEWAPGSQNDRYHDSDGGFSAPWLALLAERRRENERGLALEKAQIFMLGKLLWCIFEEEPLVRCGIDHELLQDNNNNDEEEDQAKAVVKAFPQFEMTPPEIQDLIRRCTTGAPEWNDGSHRSKGGWVIALRNGKLVPGDTPSPVGGGPCDKDTQAVAMQYWMTEVDRARLFMREMLEFLRGRKDGGNMDGSVAEAECTPAGLETGGQLPRLLGEVRMRPALADVLGELERISV
ncbi:hypothetical protein B0H66DRAFT_486544 [Apodospora peruviana]|uniref:Protein kinase domain-containing protein n=1 Tax=Apodospora peruviana TaxID=516989 RepID=A0AAE0LY34_9PEZI|nr:hypothetical protein B0H66DRAFT_486544 [Apodospora peruviana]